MLSVENKHIMLSVVMPNAFILNVVVPETWQSKLGHFIRPEPQQPHWPSLQSQRQFDA